MAGIGQKVWNMDQYLNYWAAGFRVRIDTFVLISFLDMEAND